MLFTPYVETPPEPKSGKRAAIDWNARLENARRLPGTWWVVGEWTCGTAGGRASKLRRIHTDIDFRSVVAPDKSSKLYARTKGAM